MARPMTPFTIAVRKLCDQKGFDLHYADARPLLTKEGVEVVAEPNWDMDNDIKAYWKKAKEIVEAHNDFDEKSDEHQQWLAERVVEALGLKGMKLKAIQKELIVRDAYNKEKARFDVQKSTYNVSVNGSSRRKGDESSKPASGKDTTSRVKAGADVAAKTGRKVGRPAKVKPPEVTGGDSLAFINTMGGIAAAKKKLAENNDTIASLQAENEEIEAHIAAVVESAKAMLSEAEAA